MAATAKKPTPRVLAERVAALARRLAERNRVLREEVDDLRAYIDRLHTQTPQAAQQAVSHTPIQEAPVAAPTPPPAPPAPTRDRESEQLLELVRDVLERTLNEVDDHLERVEEASADANS